MREVITTLILEGFGQKSRFFEEWSWFKFNNLGLALGTNVKFYTSVAKGLKVKVRKFGGLIHSLVEVTGKKLVGEPFCPTSPSWIGLTFIILQYIFLISWKKTCLVTYYKSIGRHWIALNVSGNSVTYFDSFGVEPFPEEIEEFIDNKNIMRNFIQIEAYDSITCFTPN